MDEPAGAAVGPQTLHLVRDADHAAPPRLNVHEVGPLPDVREGVYLAAVVLAFCQMQLPKLVQQINKGLAGRVAILLDRVGPCRQPRALAAVLPSDVAGSLSDRRRCDRVPCFSL